MRKLSIPYTMDNQILDKLSVENLRHVGEIYMPIPFSIAKSARIVTKRQAEEYKDIILDKMKQAKELGLKISIVCNAITNYREFNKTEIGILKFIKNNREYIDKLCIADLTLLRRMDDIFVELALPVELSVVNDISTIAQFETIIANFKSIQSVCLGNAFIHNVEDIKYIKNKYPSINLKIMVNHGCLVECPSFYQHHTSYSIMIDDTDDITDPIEYTYNMQAASLSDACRTCTHSDNSRSPLGKSAYIRPEDLVYYDSCIDQFKIVGRDRSSDTIIEITEAYCNRVYADNLFEITPPTYTGPKVLFNNLLPNDFGERRSKCKHRCHKCNYCDAIYDRFSVEDDL